LLNFTFHFLLTFRLKKNKFPLGKRSLKKRMQITTERLEDLPFLASFMSQSGLPDLLDEHYPVHGSWQGTSYGKTAMGFLLYVLSEGKHDLYGVESWASERVEALKWLLDCPSFEPRHLSDDRLGLLLERFHGPSYEAFQRAHNQELLKAYQLENQGVARLDSVKAQSFCGANELFGKGHKQSNKREDLVSLKAMMVSIDPLALPMSTLIVRGNRADDQLYAPAIEKAWAEGLSRKGMLLVGDSKLGSLPNWAFIAQSGNYYLSPLALKQFSLAELGEALSWIEGSQVLQVPFYGHRYEEGELPEEHSQPKAFCVELPSQTKSDPLTGISWQHRLLAVCNVEMRQKQLSNLEQRCEQAIIQIKERFITKQGRKRINDMEQA
jgi:transposase